MNIKDLSSIFGSKTKAQEIFFLLKNSKKVVRQGFYEKELSPIQKFCEKNNLALVKSKFKVLIADETSYSNKGIRIKWDDKREGMYFVYFSKNEKDAWLASYYELIKNDEDLGAILGYPRCCIRFFKQRFSENNPNLQLTPTNVFTNLIERHNDNVIISHFPCSSDCEESINIGKTFFNLIFEFDKTRAEELLRSLKSISNSVSDSSFPK
jgi:hypothetical protein